MRKISAKADHKSPHLSCLPYGVGHDQEGVCLMLNLGQYRIILDCGITELSSAQSLKDLPVADFIFCSHAHKDHCRGLPQINQHFPKIPIYTSEVTAKLLPLYWSKEISRQVIAQVSPLAWRSPVTINKQLQFELFAKCLSIVGILKLFRWGKLGFSRPNDYQDYSSLSRYNHTIRQKFIL